MTRTKKIGIETKPPSKTCDDPNCPFHGELKVRGKSFTGTVLSDKMQKSVTVEWQGRRFVPKYERYKKIRTKVIAHNPPCLDASEGDRVVISECKSLSKRKNFVVIEVLGEDFDYQLKKEALDEGRHREDKKPSVKQASVEEKPPEESPLSDSDESVSLPGTSNENVRSDRSRASAKPGSVEEVPAEEDPAKEKPEAQ
jgi:small subunit ribosomal protein S17